MKKIVISLLLAATAISGASTASAWGRTRCDFVADIVPNSKTLAKNCGRYIYKHSIISFGNSKGKEWGREYPNAHLGGEEMLSPFAHRKSGKDIPNQDSPTLSDQIEDRYFVTMLFDGPDNGGTLGSKHIANDDLEGFINNSSMTDKEKSDIRTLISNAKIKAYNKDIGNN